MRRLVVLAAAAGVLAVSARADDFDPASVPDLLAPSAAGAVLDSLARLQGMDAASFRVDPARLDFRWSASAMPGLARYLQTRPFRAPAMLTAVAASLLPGNVAVEEGARVANVLELAVPMRFSERDEGGPDSTGLEDLLGWLYASRGGRFTGRDRERILENVAALGEDRAETVRYCLLVTVSLMRLRETVLENSEFRSGGAFGARLHRTRTTLAAYRKDRLAGGDLPPDADLGRALASFPVGEALGGARVALDYVNSLRRHRGDAPEFHFVWETPSGRIGIGGGGNDTFAGEFLLVVDFGGDDVYSGPGACDVTEAGAALVVDWAGNDTYRPAEGSDVGPGGAVLGTAGILDFGMGNDRYAGGDVGLGFGLLGVGWIIDHGGDDRYEAGLMGEGAGWHGAGILFDKGGDDVYDMAGSERPARGQGYGAQRGVGLLVDFGGDDTYEGPDSVGGALRRGSAQGLPSHAVYDLGHENTDPERVGGLGFLVDASGNDTYVHGMSGCGWTGGVGAVLDLSGNDVWTGELARGEDGGVGIVVDAGGDDRYDGILGTGLSEGLGLFVDAAGADTYVGNLGTARDRGMGAFFDLGGEDSYETARVAEAAAGAGGPWSLVPTIALYIDVNGANHYANRSPRGGGFGGVYPLAGSTVRGGAAYRILEITNPLGGSEPE